MKIKNYKVWKKYPLGMLSASFLLIVFILLIAFDTESFDILDLLVRIGMVMTLFGIAYDTNKKEYKRKWILLLLFLIYTIGKIILYNFFPNSHLYDSYQVTMIVLFSFLFIIELGKEKTKGLTGGIYYFLKSILSSIGFFIITILVEFGVLALIDYFVEINYKVYPYIISISAYIIFQYFLSQLGKEEESKFLDGFHQWILIPASIIMIFTLLIGSIITIMDQEPLTENILFNYYFFILIGWLAYFLSDWRLLKDRNLWHDRYQKAFPVINGVLSLFLLAFLIFTPKENFLTPAILYFLYTILLNIAFGFFSFMKNFHRNWSWAFIFFIVLTISPIGPYPVAISNAKKEVDKVLMDHPKYLENGNIKKEILKDGVDYNLNNHFINYILWTNKDFYGFDSDDVYEISKNPENNEDYIHYEFYNKPIVIEETTLIHFPYSYLVEGEEYYIQTQRHSFSIMKGKKVLDNFSLENIHQQKNQESILLVGEKGNYFILSGYEEYLNIDKDKKEINVEGIFVMPK